MLRPELPVIVRTIDDNDIERLLKAGAAEVVPEVQEGREHFLARISEDIPNRDHLFDRAVVDVMVKQAGRIKSTIW